MPSPKDYPRKTVKPVTTPVGLSSADFKNEEERAQYVQREMERICAQAGMKVVCKNVPQLQIIPTRAGTLEECLNDYNKDDDKGPKTVPEER